MSTENPAGLQTSGTDDSTDTLDERDVRALTEYLTVLEDQGRVRGAPGLYEVVSQSGEAYLVDTHDGRCECWDDRRDDRPRCKHRRRIEFATGEREIPAWIDRDAVDPDLGAHVNGPRFAATDGGSDVIEAGDDGEVLDEDPDDDGDEPVVDLADETGDAEPPENARPDDCDCAPFLADAGLPCWPCWRDGWREPNPDATEESSDD